MNASFEKTTETLKKNEVETSDENVEKMVEKLKKAAEEARTSEKTEVKIQTESSESLNQVKSMGNNDEIDNKSENKIEVRCRKCMETCNACTEKDENLRSSNIEFTKIENVFKEKCKEMFKNEKILKQSIEKLPQKCNDFEKENEIFKQKCSTTATNVYKKIISFESCKKNMMG
ncbi:hypothetical protein Hanom_Chr14g01325331 [Helianthus anomalus]